MVGHRWSARSSEVREFLARNQVPYRWYNSDEPEAAAAARGGAGADGLSLPVVITPDGDALVEPTDAELAARVGLATTPSKDFYDLVVIGGGPAGLGAAVYGASEGLRTVLVERTATGGQAGQSSRIENYLGFPDGVSGAQLTDRARRQAAKFGAEVLTTRDVVGLDVNGSARTVRFADGSSIDAHTIILATGVTYRQLARARPGRPDRARGVLRVRAHRGGRLPGPGRLHRRRRELGRAGRRLPVPARQVGDDPGAAGPRWRRSMSYYLIQQIEDDRRTSPCGPAPRSSRRAATITWSSLTLREHRDRRDTETVDAQWLFVFIGAAPLTDWLDGVVVRDARGFVRRRARPVGRGRRGRAAGSSTGRRTTWRPACPGVFVAGDARAESAKRVASAVGEGAHGRHARTPLPGEAMTCYAC